jgi:thymidylate synthase (FAD)
VTSINTASDVTVTLVHEDAADLHVVHAARVSTLGEHVMGKLEDLGLITSEQWRTREMLERDRGLIGFLMRDHHGTPFEHNSLTFMVKAPIFIAREFMRHRAGWSYNEESGRYRELEPNFYVPGPERKLVQVGKPGAYQFLAGTDDQARIVNNAVMYAYEKAWSMYKLMLNEGVAREVARVVLPVGIFTTFYATCNARSLMHFLSLRTQDERAKTISFPQWEIELVAGQMEKLWAAVMPVTYAAFNEHGRCAP